jgi:Na+-transporting NADH:ubiquinone oxidoreductase subunit B
MSTDPVSAPKKQPAQLAYGLLIGAVVVVIRTFSLFPEGTSFAILIGNTFASIFDKHATASAKRKAESAKEAAAKKAADAKAPAAKEAAQ